MNDSYIDLAPFLSLKKKLEELKRALLLREDKGYVIEIFKSHCAPILRELEVLEEKTKDFAEANKVDWDGPEMIIEDQAIGYRVAAAATAANGLLYYLEQYPQTIINFDQKMMDGVAEECERVCGMVFGVMMVMKI